MKLLTVIFAICVFFTSCVQCTSRGQESIHPPSDDQRARNQRLNSKICANIARDIANLESFSVTDTRLTPLLRELINSLFVLYPELIHEHLNITKTVSPSGDEMYSIHKPDASKLPGIPCMDSIDALTDLANRKLLQAIAEGPSRETLRMLSGRLVKVLRVRELIHAWRVAKEEDIPEVIEKYWDVETGWWSWAR